MNNKNVHSGKNDFGLIRNSLRWPVRFLLTSVFIFLLMPFASAQDDIFVEAENFSPSSDGWTVCSDAWAAKASRGSVLYGAYGDVNDVATHSIIVSDAANYRVWVRYYYHTSGRGPFVLSIQTNSQEVASGIFDLDVDVPDGAVSGNYVWDFFDTDLPSGTLDLRLSKYQNENCNYYTRYVDCMLLTTNKDLTPPDHIPYGPQTYLRVTVGDLYADPVYVFVFADHFRAPWYAYYNLSKAGTQTGYNAPSSEYMLSSGEQTSWCNITPLLYQDSGARLDISLRHTYWDSPQRMDARFEFATSPDSNSIVRTMDVVAEPNGLIIIAPPDLTTTGNIARLKRDIEFAEELGAVADAFNWPVSGKAPEEFPFSASENFSSKTVDQSVIDREQQTLDYFGFAKIFRLSGGIWYTTNSSYCSPDIDRMETTAASAAASFLATGKTVDDITFCLLMDEPLGQSAEFMAGDYAYQEAFRAWLQDLGETPTNLLVADWNAVVPVAETNRDLYPALHYYTQRFRTRALGDFMVTQHEILEEAYGGTFPTVANFSDGAISRASFYHQGVDYFELLTDDRQNAIWSEDWSSLATSYQCAAYNVDLMRGAARQYGQTIGHYLVAHHDRTAWDTKTKVAGEVARGVKMLHNFVYGPEWASHQRCWVTNQGLWQANAEIVREVGGAEDLLLPAMPPPADVAILYSSSSDIWTFDEYTAYGYDRMHTWMALTHAQIPVDILSESQVEDSLLDGYRVCYLSGPNLTGAAAEKIKTWVENGGTLVLTAGAASRDEFNRPLSTLETILPCQRGTLQELQEFNSYGRYLSTLLLQDEASGGGTVMDVVSVKQTLVAGSGAEIYASFLDGSPAMVSGSVGDGNIYCSGFLPALDYVRKATVARRLVEIEKEALEEAGGTPTTEQEARFALVDRSYNPWDYPADVRDFILAPVRDVGIEPPLTCSVPLVDAVPMTCNEGVVIPLANHTLEPIQNIDFTLRMAQPVFRVETIYQGEIDFQKVDDRIEFSLPLECTDFVKIVYDNNSIPYVETFESYTNGFALSGTNGWMAATHTNAVVTTNAALILSLAAYSEPCGYSVLSATHTKVLEVNGTVANLRNMATNQVVWVDYMTTASQGELPADTTIPAGIQTAIGFNPDGHPVIWQYNLSAGSNDWAVLNDRTVADDEWVRLTFKFDYQTDDPVNHVRYFQVHLNGIRLTNALAWTSNDGAGASGGAWFAMSSEPDRLNRFSLRGEESRAAALDDFVITTNNPLVTPMGIPFEWLVLHGLTNRTFSGEELLDVDSDGQSAIEEWISDTDPTNGASVLQLTTLESEGSKLRMHWTGGVQAMQVLERSENLVSGSWISLFTNYPPTSITNSFIDPAATNHTEFYRLKARR